MKSQKNLPENIRGLILGYMDDTGTRLADEACSVAKDLLRNGLTDDVIIAGVAMLDAIHVNEVKAYTMGGLEEKEARGGVIMDLKDMAAYLANQVPGYKADKLRKILMNKLQERYPEFYKDKIDH